jgi:hypothetical protein
MRQICVLLAVLAVGVLLIGEGQSGDKGTQAKPKFPPLFKKLNLTEAQVNGVKTIQANYARKREDLNAQEEKELLNVLTREQKTQLRQIIAEKLRDDEGKSKKGDSKDK